MNKEDLEHFLEPDSFVPFSITTVDGFAVPVPDLRHILVGDQLAVVLNHAACRSISGTA